MIEAKKLAYEDRATLLRRPGLRPRCPVKELISKAYAAKRRALIDRRAGQRPPDARRARSRPTRST